MSDQFSEIPERVDALRFAIMHNRYNPSTGQYEVDDDVPDGLPYAILEDVLTAVCNLTLTCQEILDELRSRSQVAK